MSPDKKHIVFDLDNTLLSAEALTDFPFTTAGMKEKAMKFAIHDMDGYYIIFERPHVQEFLDYVFDNFTVSVWTAASKDYALFVVKHILLTKPSRRLRYLFFSYHCKLSRTMFKNDSKNLELLRDVFDLKHEFSDNACLIIDDLAEVYDSQPHCAINIPAFEILDDGSEHDNVLMGKIKPLLEEFQLRDTQNPPTAMTTM
jgi:TFIIF-interacting CTD phosphatase-like protein